MVGNNSSTRSAAASEAAAVIRLADQLGESPAWSPTELMVRTVLAIEPGTLRSGTEGLSQVTRELEATNA